MLKATGFCLLASGIFLGCSGEFRTYKVRKTYDWPSEKKSATNSISAVLDKNNLHDLRALVVIQDDTLIFEEYFNGISELDAFNIKSASKSILSILVGIAIDRNKLRLNQPISALLHEEIPNSPTIEDLLTMKGGYPESYTKISWVSKFSNHPAKALLKTRTAGDKFEPAYSTIGADILGYCVAASTGKSLLQFGNEVLFDPLGIQVGRWPQDRLGNNIAGADFYITARDLGRIGQLMLHEGIIEGKTVVSPEWIARSTHKKTQVLGMDYGYMWWIDSDLDSANYYAAGYKGQVMYLSPKSKSVVIVFGNFEKYRTGLELAREVIKGVLLGARR